MQQLSSELHPQSPCPSEDKISHSQVTCEICSNSDDLAYQNEKTSPVYFKRLAALVNSITMRLQGNRAAYEYHIAPTDDEANGGYIPSLARKRSRSRPSTWLRYIWKRLWSLTFFVLVVFGLLHITLVVCGGNLLFWDPEHIELVIPQWISFANTHQGRLTYPTDATRDVTPIPCHSHNDYWRKVPLFDALRWGCTSVEADVWLFDGEEELFVGHSTASLTRNRTFRSLYVNPLVDLLNGMNPETEFGHTTDNGVFDEDPEQTLVLLVDFKTDGDKLFRHVSKQLEPLRQRNWLSHWNGEDFVSRAVTVVATGNAPFDLIIKDKTYRNIFFDAPLDLLWEDSQDHTSSGHHDKDLFATTGPKKRTPLPAQGSTGIEGVTSPDDFNQTNSYFASVPFITSIGYPLMGRLSQAQLEIIRGHIRGAKRRGLKARYWETPSWPTSLRNYVWETLIKEGADILNVDDLKSAATLDWTAPVGHAWFDAK